MQQVVRDMPDGNEFEHMSIASGAPSATPEELFRLSMP
jgi:hypothetical protein